jgi:hypothetical protein
LIIAKVGGIREDAFPMEVCELVSDQRLTKVQTSVDIQQRILKVTDKPNFLRPDFYSLGLYSITESFGT